jgi:putative membrane protein
LERLLLGALLLHALACQIVLATASDWLEARPKLLEAGLAIFAQSQILATFLVLAFFVVRRSKRWLPVLGALGALGFAADWIGVGTGLPFGRYAFTDLLAPKLGDRVPLLLPLSWVNASVPAWAVAATLLPKAKAPARVFAATLLMVSWDLLVDPIMGHRYLFWIWAEGGPYYGIPLTNFAGWLLVGTVLVSILESCAPPLSGEKEPLVSLYGVSLFGPLGMVLISQFWLAAALALPAIACAALARVRATRVTAEP